MNRTILSALCLLVTAGTSFARTVSTGTVVANPGATISVPVTVDDLSEMRSAVAVIGYDATVLVCLGVDNDELADAKDMTCLDSGNGRICAIFSGFKTSEGGELMRIRFSVRDGTQGLFSDVTLQDFQCGAKDGVSDLSVKNPLTVVNGMVRVMAPTAEVKQLEECFTVWPKSCLSTAELGGGCKLKASADATATQIDEVKVVKPGTISVERPVGGWRTCSYALLTTATSDLSLALEGTSDYTLRMTSSNGKITYWADVEVDGCLEIVAENGPLPVEVCARIEGLLKDEIADNPGVTKIVVNGDAELIPIAADLGIAPTWSVLGSEAVASYSKPSIRIIAFNPETGAVRMKVIPGEGNEIRAQLVTGCVHVYGADDLRQRMRYMIGTGFDLTPYLKPETKGEADLTVALGDYTFVKIKAENKQPKEGDQE